MKLGSTQAARVANKRLAAAHYAATTGAQPNGKVGEFMLDGKRVFVGAYTDQKTAMLTGTEDLAGDTSWMDGFDRIVMYRLIGDGTRTDDRVAVYTIDDVRALAEAVLPNTTSLSWYTIRTISPKPHVMRLADFIALQAVGA